jgi:acyl-CoA hydrolase
MNAEFRPVIPQQASATCSKSGPGAATAPESDVTSFVEMVFPEQANHYGTLFGGNALSLMGKAAFVAATRRARCSIVMASSDQVKFHLPVRVGELVELTAKVERQGRTSLVVVVEMMAEELLTGRRRIAARGSFQMVAVDESGRPIPIIETSAKEEMPS